MLRVESPCVLRIRALTESTCMRRSLLYAISLSYLAWVAIAVSLKCSTLLTNTTTPAESNSDEITRRTTAILVRALKVWLLGQGCPSVVVWVAPGLHRHVI